MHPNLYEPLRLGVQQTRVEVMPKSGHLPVLDEPEKTLTIIRSFLDDNAVGI